MPQLIQVLPIDIAAGVKCNAGSCPIALAAKRVFLGKQVGVGTISIVVEDKLCSLPPIAARFVKDYDNGNDVKPFNFAVDF